MLDFQIQRSEAINMFNIMAHDYFFSYRNQIREHMFIQRAVSMLLMIGSTLT